jgi:hypothetical protein
MYGKLYVKSIAHTPNYMFKPTPELTLRLLWLGGRRGLTWR